VKYCKITNNSSNDYSELISLIHDLYGFMRGKLGLKTNPEIIFHEDEENAKDILGKTAHYQPDTKQITVYVSSRHPKDIMRSIAHELIHHCQNEQGQFDNIGYIGPGYAQTNKHMRNMEKSAYLLGNTYFRDWSDTHKNNLMESIYQKDKLKRRNIMEIHDWKNKELNRLLMEKFDFKTPKKEYDLEEGADRIFAPNHYCAHHVVHEGQEAYTVDHNWDSDLNEVTEYDIKFEDGTIKRNVPVAQLEVLQAFDEGSHGNRTTGHPDVKKAKKEEDEKEKTNEELENPKKADLNKDGKLSDYEKRRGKAIEKAMEEEEEKKNESLRSQIRSLIEEILELK
jgi:hypothetical protein